MELEQLIGTNSFGNAIKQPFLLRRLDLLTLLLFFVWCLSPLGSQALQRVYWTEYDIIDVPGNTTMRVLDMTRPNQLFNSQNQTDSFKNMDFTTQLQLISSYYSTTFLPLTYAESIKGDDQDRYNNILFPLNPKGKFGSLSGQILNGTSGINRDLAYSSSFGASIYLPKSQISAEEMSDPPKKPKTKSSKQTNIGLPWDDVFFSMNQSYCKF
jgi:hypothetical protein